MKPGARLRRWADYLCSRRIMEQLIDPVIADLQHEYEEANASGRLLQGKMARLRGYLAFWKVLALHVPSVWLEGTIRTLIAEDWSPLRRALLPAAMTMVVVTAVLIAPPVQGMAQRGVVGAWLLALLVPQSLPFSIPLTILTGVVCGLRGRVQTRPLRRVVRHHRAGWHVGIGGYDRLGDPRHQSGVSRNHRWRSGCPRTRRDASALAS